MTVRTNILNHLWPTPNKIPFKDPRVINPIPMELYQHVFDTVLGICHVLSCGDFNPRNWSYLSTDSGGCK